MFRLSRWLCQGNIFVLIFALVLHVVTLCLQWPLAQTISCSLGWQYGPVHSLSFLDVYDMKLHPPTHPTFKEGEVEVSPL
jgi:hypothetical protein